MSVLTIGDIGVVSGMIHIGDEAMFEAARDELATRGLDVVGVSSAPEESAARYGVPCVPRLGFVGLEREAAARRRCSWMRRRGAPSSPTMIRPGRF
ncbi:hypothetical protein [Microbacterium sp.]|uniref:hypothetical protein n=1 Tax=Microbacterium sp. TaxID=51671 RepID=UPI0028AA2275|nr:hypothetical protein [Microbacterium sp.]